VKRVSFFVAGVARGGTTAMFNVLQQHHSLGFSETKEPHFFDNEKMCWENPKYDELYHAKFSTCAADALLGEATPIYSYWLPTMRRIKDYNPEAKIIIILRDPVARAISHWRYNRLIGWDNLDFTTAIRAGRERLLSGNVGHAKLFSYVERSLYANQIDRINYYFPRDQVYYCQVARLSADPLGLADDVCRFLGVGSFQRSPIVSFDNSTRGTEYDEPSPDDVAYLKHAFSQDAVEVEQKLGWKIEQEEYR
jgi:hypothetical protein